MDQQLNEQALTQWIAERNWTHGFTILLGPKTDLFDAERLARLSRYALRRALFGRQEPRAEDHQGDDLWWFSVCELSDGDQWHVHGAVSLLSARKVRKFERHGLSILKATCDRFVAGNGVKALAPSVEVVRLDEPPKWVGYVSKMKWRDSVFVL